MFRLHVRMGLILGLAVFGACATGGSNNGAVEGVALLGDAPPPPVSSQLVDQGEGLLEKGKIKEAKELFQRAIKEEPKDARAHFDLGLAFEMSEQPARAERSYKQALRLEPDFAQAQNNLALLLRERGALKQAVGLLRKAVAANPKSASAHANLAMALEDVGNDAEARKSYQRSLEIDPSGLMARLNYGLLLVRLGKNEEGAEQLDLASDEADGNRAALLAIGQGYRMVGRPQDAVRALEEALDAGDGEPTPALLSELALAQHAADDLSGAKASLTRALELDPKYATAHYLLGNLAGASKDYEAAEKHYERYLALEPKGPLAAKTEQRLAMVRKLRRRQ